MMCVCVCVCVGVGSDRQSQLQDYIHVGQCSHDHSTHPKERGCRGWSTIIQILHCSYVLLMITNQSAQNENIFILLSSLTGIDFNIWAVDYAVLFFGTLNKMMGHVGICDLEHHAW